MKTNNNIENQSTSVVLNHIVKEQFDLKKEIVSYKKRNRQIKETMKILQKRKTIFELVLSIVTWLSIISLLISTKAYSQVIPSGMKFFVESADIRHNNTVPTDDATDLDIARCETNDCLTEPFTELVSIDGQYCDVTNDCGEGCVRRWLDQSDYSINNDGNPTTFDLPEYSTGRNFGQDDIVKPCYIDNCVNGQPCVRGGGGVPFATDGTEQDKYVELQLNDYVHLSGAFSIFMLAKPVAQTEDWFYFGFNSDFFRHRVADNYLQIRIHPDNGVWRVTPNNSVALNVWQLIEIHRDASDQITVYINGIDKTNVPSSNGGKIILPGEFSFGYLLSAGKTDAKLGNELSMHGDMAAFLVYDKLTSGTENNSIREYFDANYLGNVLGTQKTASKNNFEVYPNPVTDQVTLKVKKTGSSSFNIKNEVPVIYDSLGKKIQTITEKKEVDNYIEFNIKLDTKLAKGFYLINFRGVTTKLIKN